MTKIKIFELTLAGSELFQDSETFLDQLSDRELYDVQGGAIAGLQSIPGVGTIPDIAFNGGVTSAITLPELLGLLGLGLGARAPIQ